MYRFWSFTESLGKGCTSYRHFSIKQQLEVLAFVEVPKGCPISPLPSCEKKVIAEKVSFLAEIFEYKD